MTGHVRQRGKNSWEVIVSLGKGQDGKYHQARRTVHGTKTDAEAALAELLVSLAPSRSPDGPTRGHPALGTPNKVTLGVRWVPTYCRNGTIKWPTRPFYASSHNGTLENPNKMVPRDGVEPPTRGFSVLCSTT